MSPIVDKIVEQARADWRRVQTLSYSRNPRAYLKSVDTIPDLGKKRHTDKYCCNDAPVCLIRTYAKFYVKHVSTITRSTNILVYLLGGNPFLARMLLLWLQCAEDADIPMSSYVFESKEIILQHHKYDSNAQVKVNSRDCMDYLTELADPNEMLLDAMVADQKDLW